MENPSIKVNNVDFFPGICAFGTFFAIWIVVDGLTSNFDSVILGLPLILLTTYFLQWAYIQRFNFGRAVSRAHFDELNLLQLPRASGITFDCCSALEPPTMYITSKKEDAADVDVPEFEEEQQKLKGQRKICTCNKAKEKERASASVKKENTSGGITFSDEPQNFKHQSENERADFERKRDAMYANEAVIADKVMKGEMTVEEAQKLLNIKPTWDSPATNKKRN